MKNYSVVEINPTQSIIAELEPILIGRLIKARPYVLRFALYLLSGCIYTGIIYLILLVIGGVLIG